MAGSSQEDQNAAAGAAFLALIFIGAVAYYFAFKKTPAGIEYSTGYRLLAGAELLGVGFVGWLVGDFIRRLAMPSAVIASGGIDTMLRIKLWWMIGPQCVGMGALMYLLWPMVFPTPSFNCTAPSTVQEKLICQDRGLARSDTKVSKLYGEISQTSWAKQASQTQKSWNKNVRGACEDVNCLSEAYAARESELKKIVDEKKKSENK